MNINYLYENMFVISNDCKDNFKRKNNLSVLEKIGLEAVLVAFLCQYEYQNFGSVSENREGELRGYTYWHDDCIDILDGVYDTYEFDGYLFCEMWTTENGCLMMTAAKIPENHIDDWQDCDWNCNDEFEEVYIRLD